MSCSIRSSEVVPEFAATALGVLCKKFETRPTWCVSVVTELTGGEVQVARVTNFVIK